MTVFPYRNRKPLVWDAKCMDTFAAANVFHSALQPACTADHAEAKKGKKYQQLTDRYIFQPIAVATA